MHYPIIAGACQPTPSQRLAAYRELATDLERFFSAFIAPYCRNCRSVIARLPEAAGEDIELVSGVDPGCCHRGAGDIFRLEGQVGERQQLAPELVVEIQQERGRIYGAGNQDEVYYYRRRGDARVLSGAHCRYFGPCGCRIGNLKGPLCLNFICPSIRRDLLAICSRSPEVIGPEYDFLFIYMTMATIAYEDETAVAAALADHRRRQAGLEESCRDFLAGRRASSLHEFFQARNKHLPVSQE